MRSIPGDAQARLRDRVRDWRVVPEQTIETEQSILVFGFRDEAAVVLKVMKRENEEWRAGDVLAAFTSLGAVRVYEHVPGAVLLERLVPATSLVETARQDDDHATRIIADVIARLQTEALVEGVATVEDWGTAFSRYLCSGSDRIDQALVVRAHRVYEELCESQLDRRLLHGDLHHDNVVYDRARGWVAIDPKGVIGELEYELGAALRNPNDFPVSFLQQQLSRRVDIFAERLGLDRQRILGWAFSQSVLSSIWALEDAMAP